MNRSSKTAWITLAAVGALAWILPASAAQVTALHAFCVSPATCTDNGTVTATSTSSPTFGFWESSGPATGDFLVEILVPNNYALPPGFTVTGGTSSPVTATEVGSGWTTGFLDSYLGITASPANPIGAWLPTTVADDPAATGYYVFQADLGVNTLQPQSNELNGPLLNVGSLDTGSLVVGFLANGNVWTATASSGALYETGHNVAEPGTLALFAAGLLGCVMLIARRRRRRQS